MRQSLGGVEGVSGLAAIMNHRGTVYRARFPYGNLAEIADYRVSMADQIFLDTVRCYINPRRCVCPLPDPMVRQKRIREFDDAAAPAFASFTAEMDGQTDWDRFYDDARKREERRSK